MADFSKIDVHAHMVPDFYKQAILDAGDPHPEGMPGIADWTPEMHFKFMEEQNIRKTYLSMASPGVNLTGLVLSDNDEHAKATIALTRRLNEYGSEMKKTYPDRFGYLAMLPLPNIAASLAEIEHCASNLDVDGYVLLSNAQGMYLGDPRMEPIYERLDALKAVVLQHPIGPCPLAMSYGHEMTPSHSHLSHEQRRHCSLPMGDRYKPPMLEFMFETTRTFSDVLLNRVPDRYPNVQWIVPHCGAALPSIIDRIINLAPFLNKKPEPPASNASDSASDKTAASSEELPPLSADHVKHLFATRFHFDLAGFPYDSQVEGILRWAPLSRLLYGSDVPWTPWPMAAGCAKMLEGKSRAMFGSEDKIKAIFRGNAEALLGKVD